MMRAKISYLLLVLCLCCGIASVSAQQLDQSNDTYAVAQAYKAWCAAIEKQDPKAVVAFYADGALLLPTLNPKLLVNKIGNTNTDFYKYFIYFVKDNPKKCHEESLTTVVKGDMAYNLGFYNFTVADPAHPPVKARFTYVYKKQQGKWLIVHHHSSLLPDDHDAKQFN